MAYISTMSYRSKKMKIGKGVARYGVNYPATRSPDYTGDARKQKLQQILARSQQGRLYGI